MSQRTVDSWVKQWTCVAGTCAPPPSPAANLWERTLDTYVNLTAPVLRGCWAPALGAGVFLVSRWAGGAGLYVSAAYFAAYGTYCLANFARCREAHCIVTGIGWLILAAVALGGALTGQGSLSQVWTAFLIVFVLGHGFELVWAATRHTHVLRLS